MSTDMPEATATSFEAYGINCRYERGRLLGRGTFGDVYEGVITERGNFIGEGDVVAIKYVDLRKRGELSISDENGIKLLKRLKMLTILSHSHLLTFHKISVAIASESLLYYELLMDYCNGGDLAQYLRNLSGQGPPLDELAMTCYAMQLADGLAYLHVKGGMHLDLKPANVLIKRTTRIHRALLIADLDEFVPIQGSKTSRGDISGFHGTVRYAAPEMQRSHGVDLSDEMVGRKADVWSLGCVFLDIANFGSNLKNNDSKWLYHPKTREKIELPKETNTEFIFIDLIVQGWVPFVADTVPETLAVCIQKCLARDCLERVSAGSLLNWLKEAVANQINCRTAEGTMEFPKCFCATVANSTTTSIGKQHGDAGFRTDSSGDEYIGSDCSYEIIAPICDLSDMKGVPIPSDTYSARLLARGDFAADETALLVTVLEQRSDSLIASKEEWSELRNGCRLISELRHRHLIPYHKITLKRGGCGEVFAIEFMTDSESVAGEDMTLYANIRNNRISVDQPTVACYAMQIADGLKFLHKNNIVHGNLNLTTVLVKRKPTGHHVLRIDLLNRNWQMDHIFFGPEDRLDLIHSFVCASPEMLRKRFLMEDDIVGCKTDVWSLRCIVAGLVNIGAGIRDKWLHKKITGEKVRIPLPLPRVAFARKLLDNFAPYVAGSTADSLARCIKQCLVLNTAHRLALDDLLGKLTEVIRDLASSPQNLPTVKESSHCDCSAILSTMPLQLFEMTEIPPSKDMVLVLYHHEVLDYEEWVTNLYVESFDTTSATLRPVSLPPGLFGRQFLPYFFAQNDQVILCAKSVILDQPKQLVDVIACDLRDRTWQSLGSSLEVADCLRNGVMEKGVIYFWNEMVPGAYMHKLDTSKGRTVRVQNPPVPGPNAALSSKAKLIGYRGKIICSAELNGDGYSAEAAGLDQKWVLCFDPERNKWLHLPPLPEPRYGYALAAVGCYLYVIGGYIRPKACPPSSDLIYAEACVKLNMEILDVGWEELPGILVPMCDLDSFVIGHQIYLVGSSYERAIPGQQPTQMQVYDTEHGVWSEVIFGAQERTSPRMPFRRCGPTTRACLTINKLVGSTRSAATLQGEPRVDG